MSATVEKHESLVAALAAFQMEVPSIKKGNLAEVEAKSGAKFKYSYADLADINEVVLPLLGKHGLSWSSQPTILGENDFVLHYSLAHTSGEAIEGIYPLPPATTPPQQLGSAITYARRYALCAVIGIAPGGDDDDAASAPAAPARQRKAAPPKPAPVASQDWALDIADVKTLVELRDVYERVEETSELGLRFDPQHVTHLAQVAQQFGLSSPPAEITVGRFIAEVKKAIEFRDAPREGESMDDTPMFEDESADA